MAETITKSFKQEERGAVIDPKTGEITNIVETKQSYNIKRGWSRIYMKTFIDFIETIADKPSVIRTWTFLAKRSKKDGTFKPFTQKELYESIHSTRQTAWKALKELEQLEAIAKIDGEWRYNPFMFSVSNTSPDQIEENQMIWDREVGHYNFYENR